MTLHPNIPPSSIRAEHSSSHLSTPGSEGSGIPETFADRSFAPQVNPAFPSHERLGEIFAKWNRIEMDALLLSLKRHEVGMVQYFVLTFLNENPDGMAMTQIAQSMQHSTAATTGLIERMAAAGYVKRRFPKIDRRMILVSISPEGRVLLENIQKDRIREIETARAALSDKDHQTLLAMSAKLLVLWQAEPPKFEATGHDPLSEAPKGFNERHPS